MNTDQAIQTMNELAKTFIVNLSRAKSDPWCFTFFRDNSERFAGLPYEMYDGYGETPEEAVEKAYEKYTNK